MRADQEERLDDLTERLADVFLDTANPDNWSGAGEKPKEMSKETRGNMNWDVKAANQVGLLFARALELKQRIKLAHEGVPPGVPPPDPDLEISRYEREAKRLLDQAAGRH